MIRKHPSRPAIRNVVAPATLENVTMSSPPAYADCRDDSDVPAASDASVISGSVLATEGVPLSPVEEFPVSDPIPQSRDPVVVWFPRASKRQHVALSLLADILSAEYLFCCVQKAPIFSTYVCVCVVFYHLRKRNLLDYVRSVESVGGPCCPSNGVHQLSAFADLYDGCYFYFSQHVCIYRYILKMFK